MILADKIIEERKRIGLSQEELAERLDVSRQSVSKWEGAQSVPDINRIIMLAEIFGVSTDYLLKDDAIRESEDTITESAENPRNARKVSMDEASEFISLRKNQAPLTSLGVMLCIWSPIPLVFLSGLYEGNIINISDNVIGGVGVSVLLLMVAAAVAIFIRGSSRLEKFEFFENEEIDTAYGVDGMAKEKRSEFNAIYTTYTTVGVVLCIIAVVPLFISLCFTEKDFVVISMIALLLFIVGIAVNMIVRVNMIKNSFDMLLQEKDYSVLKKRT